MLWDETVLRFLLLVLASWVSAVSPPQSISKKRSIIYSILAFYGKPGSDEERFEFLDRAYELGCTHWDSAQMYGDNEVLLGKWFKRTGKRNEVRSRETCNSDERMAAHPYLDLSYHQVW